MHYEVEVNVARKGASLPVWRPMTEAPDNDIAAQWSDLDELRAEAIKGKWSDYQIISVSNHGVRSVILPGGVRIANQYQLTDVVPLVELALAHLRVIRDGLDDLEKVIADNNRSLAIGGLVMAQDHLKPMSTLIDAAVLLAKKA